MAIKTFAVGEVLTASDTNTYLANSGLVYITSTTLSGTTVTVNNVFSSTYDSYRIVLTNAYASNQGYVTIKFGSLATEYYGSSYYDQYTGSVTGVARTSNGTTLRIAEIGSDAGRTQISFDITSPYLSTRTSLSGSYYGAGFAGWFGGENYTASSSVTGFTLGLNSTYTFSGGTVTVMGYRKV